MPRAVASLTVPGGQEFHFPHFFLKFRSIFPQTLLIFFLILALRVGESPTREGPGYATVMPGSSEFKPFVKSLVFRRMAQSSRTDAKNEMRKAKLFEKSIQCIFLY